jgi:hypothetical protein
MYFADMPASPFELNWNWRTGWAQSSIAGTKNEGKRGKPVLIGFSGGTHSEMFPKSAGKTLSPGTGFLRQIK